MADSLVLKGVKDVRKHTGNEMLLTFPKRGGDTHQVKEWWKSKGVSTCYCDCTIFLVTGAGGTVKLVLDTNSGTDVRIDHDGSFNFEFFGVNEIKRAALFTADFELIEHYVFPSISGGKIMTVTPADGAAKPGGSTPAPTPTPGATPTPGPTPTPTPTPDPTPASSLTFAEQAAAADQTIAVTVASYYGNNKYYLNGTRQAEVTANAGETIYFDLSDASLSSHPLAIYTDSSKTTTVTVGIETSDNNDGLLFTPPIAGTFSYQCTAHADMGGDITIS